MKKTIIHIATENYIHSVNFITNIQDLVDFSVDNDVQNLVFFESNNEPPILLNSPTAKVYNYKDDKELIDRLKLIKEKDNIVFFSTFQEELVDKLNEVRKELGEVVSDKPEIFTNKGALRDLLKDEKDISVKYIKVKLDNLDFKELDKKLGTPFVIKPINSLNNFGIAKIKNEKSLEKYIENYKNNKNLSNKSDYDFIVEEYLEGDLYSIDYYVDSKGNISMSKVVKEFDGYELGLNDSCVFSREISEEVEDSIDEDELVDFLNKNVEILGIKNTFVSHKFKSLSKKEFKTLDIDGKTGWRRIQLYKLGYGINLFELLLKGNLKFSLEQNVSLIKICACENGILKEYNEKLIEKLNDLDSINLLHYCEDLLGTNVGPMKLGFPFFMYIFLTNKNYKKLQKDIEFVEKNYCDFAEIK